MKKTNSIVNANGIAKNKEADTKLKKIASSQLEEKKMSLDATSKSEEINKPPQLDSGREKASILTTG